MAGRSGAPWFAAKQFGYGAGLPIAWQSWVVLGVYVAVVTGCALMIARFRSAPTIVGAAIAVLTLSTVAAVAIGANRTVGGWRWRP